MSQMVVQGPPYTRGADALAYRVLQFAEKWQARLVPAARIVVQIMLPDPDHANALAWTVRGEGGYEITVSPRCVDLDDEKLEALALHEIVHIVHGEKTSDPVETIEFLTDHITLLLLERDRG